MKLFLSDKIKDVDANTIKYEPISSLKLMDRAAVNCYKWICANVNLSKKIVVFAGVGNNGGDALVIARMLYNTKADVQVCFLNFSDKISPDCQQNLNVLSELNIPIHYFDSFENIEAVNLSDSIIIDGIFGSGLSKPIVGWVGKIIERINNSNSTIVSIDTPSGLFGEDNSANQKQNGAIVKATHTLTLEQPKIAQLFAENHCYVGKLHIVPIGLHARAKEEVESSFYFLDNLFVKSIIKERSKFSHKGTYGHVIVIAGKYGMMGANILATKAAYKTGCGLVTSQVPVKGVDVVQISVPEALLFIDESDYIITQISEEINGYSAVLFGPGVGSKNNTKKAFQQLLSTATIPLVIDADGLNILSENKALLDLLPKNSILTPHPKEFERLFGKFDDPFLRVLFMQNECVKRKINIVYKGANTIIVTSTGSCFFNSTGNSGLATGGSGDVLSGIVSSLLAQGYDYCHAMCAGVWIHGKSADIAVNDIAEHSVIASDIINYLGKTIKSLIDE